MCIRDRIYVFGIVLDHGDNRVWSDETGEIVDVAVSVIPENAAAEPDHVWRAEVVGEELFVVFAGHAWIALLYSAEQTFFGG